MQKKKYKWLISICGKKLHFIGNHQFRFKAMKSSISLKISKDFLNRRYPNSVRIQASGQPCTLMKIQSGSAWLEGHLSKVQKRFSLDPQSHFIQQIFLSTYNMPRGFHLAGMCHDLIMMCTCCSKEIMCPKVIIR